MTYTFFTLLKTKRLKFKKNKTRLITKTNAHQKTIFIIKKATKPKIFQKIAKNI